MLKRYFLLYQWIKETLKGTQLNIRSFLCNFYKYLLMMKPFEK